MRRHEMRRCRLIGGVVVFAGCGAYFAPDRNISDRIEERGGLEASYFHRYTVTTDVIAAESVNLGQRHFLSKYGQRQARRLSSRA